MAIKIALGPRSQQTSGTSDSSGIRLNLPIKLGSGGASSSMNKRGAQVLRAVAVAVAMKEPGLALAKVKEIADEPRDAIPTWWAEGRLPEDLTSLLDRVNEVQEDRTSAPTADELQQIVARKIGADPLLVAAAAEFLKDHEGAVEEAREEHGEEEPSLTEKGIAWVAMIDGELLDRAARAAGKAKGLHDIPSQVAQVNRIQKDVRKLQTSVRIVKTAIIALQNRLNDLDRRMEDAEANAAGANAGVNSLAKELAALTARVSELESARGGSAVERVGDESAAKSSEDKPPRKNLKG